MENKEVNVVGMREAVSGLCAEIGHRNFLVSDMLYKIHEDRMYCAWGYSRFADYAMSEMGIINRLAQYLAYIGSKMAKMSPSVRGRVIDLGWNRARELVEVMDGESDDEWITKAENMSQYDLRCAVHEYRSRHSSKDDSEDIEDRHSDINSSMARAIHVAANLAASECVRSPTHYRPIVDMKDGLVRTRFEFTDDGDRHDSEDGWVEL